jgi:hypothetical protein
VPNKKFDKGSVAKNQRSEVKGRKSSVLGHAVHFENRDDTRVVP